MTVPRKIAHSPLHIARNSFTSRWRNPRKIPRDEHLRRFEALVVLALIGIIVAVAITGDAAAAHAVLGLPKPIVQVFQYITYLGLSGWLFALTALTFFAALLARGRGRGHAFDRACLFLAERAGFLFALLAVSGLAAQVIKHLFGRARPQFIDLVGPFHFDLMAWKASYASFPSGHSVTAFAMAVGLSYMAPRLRYPLLILAVLIAVSRVVVGAHYPSDVIAGSALGIASAILLRRVFALRGIAFRWPPSGIRLRGAGKVWPAFSRALKP